jgi:hypothetical protein
MFDKGLRQQIIADFATRHGGTYDPALFLAEVKRRGESHPAFAWFVWDDGEAAHQHRLWQARVFARDLVVKFKMEVVGRTGSIRIVETEMPMIYSPAETRKDGGGYVIVDPNDPEHVAGLCAEAATSLRSWLKRYGSCLLHVGADPAHFERTAAALEDVGADDDE